MPHHRQANGQMTSQTIRWNRTLSFRYSAFTWNTDYASFVTAPQQVRTAAKKAYEVAVMASISVDTDSASADFICRGGGD